MKLTHLTLAACLLGTHVGGCATTGAGPGSASAPGAPPELAGSTWKLPMANGRRDGRTIQFQSIAGKYQAVLKNVGPQLSNVAGAYDGVVVMELVPAGGPDLFEGTERVPGQDEREVTCSLSKGGDELKCSNEDWAWLRAS